MNVTRPSVSKNNIPKELPMLPNKVVQNQINHSGCSLHYQLQFAIETVYMGALALVRIHVMRPNNATLSRTTNNNGRQHAFIQERQAEGVNCAIK